MLVTLLEGLLQLLLSLKWTEPAFVEVLGHYLDALGPFLKYFPDAAGSVINKLFELLTSLPFVVKVTIYPFIVSLNSQHITRTHISMVLKYIPAYQDPSTNNARHARLQICASFIRIAKAADKSVLPHMKVIIFFYGLS